MKVFEFKSTKHSFYNPKSPKLNRRGRGTFRNYFPPEVAYTKTLPHSRFAFWIHIACSYIFPNTQNYLQLLKTMAKSATPDAISILLANPSPDSSSELPEIVVQVLDLKQSGNRYMWVFTIRVCLFIVLLCFAFLIFWLRRGIVSGNFFPISCIR